MTSKNDIEKGPAGSDAEAGIPEELRATSAGQTLPSLNVAEFRQYLQQVRRGEAAKSAVQLSNLESSAGQGAGEETPREAMMQEDAAPSSNLLRRPPPPTTVLEAEARPVIEAPARGTDSAPRVREGAPRGREGTARLHPSAHATGERPRPAVSSGELSPRSDAMSLPPLAAGAASPQETEPSQQTHSRLVVPSVKAPWNPSADLLSLPGRLTQASLSAARETFLDSRVGNPFEGMMNATLEMRVPPALREGSLEQALKAASDLDMVWLGPPEPPSARLSNSFGLSDEQVVASFCSLFKVEGVSGEAGIAVGVMGRLEYRLVERFGQLGKAWRQLVERCRQSDARGLQALLEPTGAFSDQEVLRALQLWVDHKHDARFWSDDDGSRLKAPRLLGYQLARKRLDALRQLKVGPEIQEPALRLVLSLSEQVGQLLAERQGLLKQHFANRVQNFTAGFMVQRGLNARPGFFWTDPVSEEL